MRHMNSSSDDLAFTDEVKVYNNEGDEEEEQEKSSENLKEDKVGLVNEGEEKTPLEFDIYHKQYAASMFKVPFSTDPRFANYFMSNYPGYMNGSSSSSSFMNNKMSLMSPPVPNPFSFIPFPIHDTFAQNMSSNRYQLPEYKRIAAAAAAAHHFYSLPSSSSLQLHDAWSSCSDALLTQAAAAAAMATAHSAVNSTGHTSTVATTSSSSCSSQQQQQDSKTTSTANRISSFSVSSIASADGHHHQHQHQHQLHHGNDKSHSNNGGGTDSSHGSHGNPSKSSSFLNDSVNSFATSSDSNRRKQTNVAAGNNSVMPTGMPLSPSMFAAAAVAAAQAAAFSSSSPAGDVSSLHKAAAAHLRFLSSLHYQQQQQQQQQSGSGGGSNGFYPASNGGPASVGSGSTHKYSQHAKSAEDQLLGAGHNGHHNHRVKTGGYNGPDSYDARYAAGIADKQMRHHQHAASFPGDCSEMEQRKSIYSSRSSVDQRGSVTSPDSPKKPHIKKPLNAFMLFMKEMRPRVQEECTLKESAAINQILGKKWHELSREDQTKYYELARKEKELHQQLYPGWSARDNYAAQSKRRKKRKLLGSGSGGGSVASSLMRPGGAGGVGPGSMMMMEAHHHHAAGGFLAAAMGYGAGAGQPGPASMMLAAHHDPRRHPGPTMHHHQSGPHTHQNGVLGGHSQPQHHHHGTAGPPHSGGTGNAMANGSNPKKCRARFGLEHQNLWCKPCRRKKKCVRFIYSTSEDSLAELVHTSAAAGLVSNGGGGGGDKGDGGLMRMRMYHHHHQQQQMQQQQQQHYSGSVFESGMPPLPAVVTASAVPLRKRARSSSGSPASPDSMTTGGGPPRGLVDHSIEFHLKREPTTTLHSGKNPFSLDKVLDQRRHEDMDDDDDEEEDIDDMEEDDMEEDMEEKQRRSPTSKLHSAAASISTPPTPALPPKFAQPSSQSAYPPPHIQQQLYSHPAKPQMVGRGGGYESGSDDSGDSADSDRPLRLSTTSVSTTTAQPPPPSSSLTPLVK